MAAPGKYDIQLTGDKQLIAVFETLDVQVQRKCLAPALRAAANQVKKDAIANAPTRKMTVVTKGGLNTPKILGGGKRGLSRQKKLQRLMLKFARLRNNFNVKALKRRRTRVGFTVWSGTRQQLGITGKYYYPAHVEWGHKMVLGRRYGALSRRAVGRVKPYPYLGPAYHQHEQAILSQITAEVRSKITSVTGVVVPP